MPSKPLVTVKRTRRVALLSLDNPPTNALSKGLRVQLRDALLELKGNELVRGVVLAGLGRCFSSGLDLTEVATSEEASAASSELREIASLIESEGKPVVAAIHGFALGAGLELAMACHGRVAVAQARLGLPDVVLGLSPGAGGTQRLPRLVGATAALEMLLSGESMCGAQAAASGLVDLAVQDDAYQAAVEFLKGRSRERFVWRLTRWRMVPRGLANANGELERSRIQARGMWARSAACIGMVDCVAASLDRTFNDAMELEGAAFMRCVQAPDYGPLRTDFLISTSRLEWVSEGCSPSDDDFPKRRDE
jgi:3-hydroxyacyl-CoA dehydrogenase